jgi:hypothetical protein
MVFVEKSGTAKGQTYHEGTETRRKAKAKSAGSESFIGQERSFDGKSIGLRIAASGKTIPPYFFSVPLW